MRHPPFNNLASINAPCLPLPAPPPCPEFRDIPSLCIQLVQCLLCDTHCAGHGKCKLSRDSLWVWELGRDRRCGGRIWQAWTGRRGGSAPHTWGVGAGEACPECSRGEDFQEEVGKSKQRRVWANTRDKKQPRAVGTWVPPHWALCQQLAPLRPARMCFWHCLCLSFLSSWFNPLLPPYYFDCTIDFLLWNFKNSHRSRYSNHLPCTHHSFNNNQLCTSPRSSLSLLFWSFTNYILLFTKIPER